MIIGKQNPLVGVTEYYKINDVLGSNIFSGDNVQYFWYLWRKQKDGKWFDITKKDPKRGLQVTYKFGETFLGTQFKIQVFKATKNVLTKKFEAKLFAELLIVPTTNKIAQIERVVLFNGGASDVNKAHYRDTLTARAYCTAMFNQTVEFHLWEDDAPKGGHNPAINQHNRYNIPFPAKVNEKGIAEVQIKLLSHESILKSIANKYVMKGDKNEGKNHEFYVTASYSGKIKNSSQVNVDVANPDYKKDSPKSQPKVPPKKPTIPSKPKQPAQSSKPKPKENTPKFPATKTSTAPRQADPQGRITDAYFVNGSGQRLSQVTVGDKVRVRIASNNMKDKHVQYVIWEYDAGSPDEIYRSTKIKLGYDLADMPEITITQDMFDEGIDFPLINDPDKKSQSYYIEVLPLDVSAESKKFGMTDEKQRMEVLKSAAVVKKKEQDKQTITCVCKAKDLVWGDKIGCNERKKVIEVAKNLGVDPNWLMTVMALETAETFSPSIDNGIGYVGLIQFGVDAAKDIGTTQNALVKMSFIDQMKYVQKHLEKNKSKFKTLTDLYLAVLYPSASGHGSERDYVVLDGKAYQNNPLFFKEKGEWEYATKVNKKGKIIKYKKAKDPNGKTYVWEIAMVAQEVYSKGLSIKEKTFSCTNSINSKKDTPKTGNCLDTWDSATNKRIEKLHPKIRCAAKNFINEVDKTLNIKLRVIQGYRTYAEQDALYNQGRTTKGKKVTNAKGGQSNHNFGLAVDVAEIKNGNIDWNEQETVLVKVAPIGKKWGFEWGGDWKSFKDKPHFEMMFGKTLAELRKLYAENGNDHTKIPL